MKKEKNALWNFFASVKLALFTLFTLAAASIIGTILEQNKPLAFYYKIYGPKFTEIYRTLDLIPDMYHSWWFLGLLLLFCFNLIVCTIERLPNVWRVVVQDNLATDPARLEKMGNRNFFKSSESIQSAANTVQDVLSTAGWKTKQETKDGGVLLFSQKGAWTRLGVYIVHMSILIIFAGAIIGAWKGQKGYIEIPEGETTNLFWPRDPGKYSGNLGFSVRCDFCTADFYESGIPKEYRSDLVVLENGKEVLKKTIEVNDPLEYKGYTFYQSNFDYVDSQLRAVLENTETHAKFTANFVPNRPVTWQKEGITFGVLDSRRSLTPNKYGLKIWFNDNKADPAEFWVDEETTSTVKRPGATYSFSIKRLCKTGLQVAKDPGVWTVYAGCIIMLSGLYVAFFLSHRRIWVFVSRPDRKTRVLLSGIANKNKFGFEKTLEALTEQFGQTGKLEIEK